MSNFSFRVQIGDGEAGSFQQVDGLEEEAVPTEYRDGPASAGADGKTPDLTKARNVALHRGTICSEVVSWFDSIKMNAIQRRTVTIELLEASGVATMRWELVNAYPVKVEGDLQTGGDATVVDTLIFVCDAITSSAC